jgi:hypothetical protein
MLICKKCKGRVFVDRTFSADNHIETFCIICGSRKFYHNWGADDLEAQWLLAAEKKRAAATISPF